MCTELFCKYSVLKHAASPTVQMFDGQALSVICVAINWYRRANSLALDGATDWYYSMSTPRVCVPLQL